MLEIHYPLSLKDALNGMTLLRNAHISESSETQQVMVRWIYLGPHLQPRLHLE